MSSAATTKTPTLRGTSKDGKAVPQAPQPTAVVPPRTPSPGRDALDMLDTSSLMTTSGAGAGALLDASGDSGLPVRRIVTSEESEAHVMAAAVSSPHHQAHHAEDDLAAPDMSYRSERSVGAYSAAAYEDEDEGEDGDGDGRGRAVDASASAMTIASDFSFTHAVDGSISVAKEGQAGGGGGGARFGRQRKRSVSRRYDETPSSPTTVDDGGGGGGGGSGSGELHGTHNESANNDNDQ